MREVLQFSADWCGPCRMAKQYLKEAHPGVEFTVIDVDKEKELADKYGVRGIPTFVLLIDEQEVFKASGFNTRLIDKLVLDLKDEEDNMGTTQ